MGLRNKFAIRSWLCLLPIFSILISNGSSQHLSLQNTPPILTVPDRNWRISETEQVGQVIARVRAEDAEDDTLVFGLLDSSSNFAHGNTNAGGSNKTLPFRIDPSTGTVYLNESLLGRGGENFFLYVTVSDGTLTAKNEVLVNILRKNNNHYSGLESPPTVTHILQNFSNFLPPFDILPGVQSARDQAFQRRPPMYGSRPGTYNVPNFNINSNPNKPTRIWPENISTKIESVGDGNSNTLQPQLLQPVRPFEVSISNASSSDTKLPTNVSRAEGNGATNIEVVQVLNREFDAAGNATNIYSIRTTMIPLIVAIIGVVMALAGILGFVLRKRLCAIGKNLKKKSKEDLAHKSQRSNLSSNLTDDSQNSMVMQHWNGPRAFGNRYVPWERDNQVTQSGIDMQQSVVHNNNANQDGGNGDNLTPASNLNGGLDAQLAIDRSKFDRWEFPRYRLKFFNILGEGAFGQVWRCEAIDIDGVTGVTTVAVKTLKENASAEEKKDLLSELKVMKSLEPHVNVVRFLGCCTDKDPTFVIIEYVNKGKLQTYLRNSRAERYYGNTYGKSNVLTSGDLTSFMYQIAKGMDYLTSRGIIHRDLAARNILINDEHTCKVADFGFARDIVTSNVYERKSEGKLPIRWMAVESLYDNIFTVKSDIWSFGILMWEIVTLGSTPYPGISAADVMRKVRDGYRLEKPEHCRRELYNIMYYCWSNEANERPSFSELVNMLDKLLHTEMDYIELERFPDHNYYNIVNPSGEKV